MTKKAKSEEVEENHRDLRKKRLFSKKCRSLRYVSLFVVINIPTEKEYLMNVLVQKWKEKYLLDRLQKTTNDPQAVV